MTFRDPKSPKDEAYWEERINEARSVRDDKIHEQSVEALNLKARIAQLEEALKADKASSDFDCPHDAEHRCRCGDLDRELWETAIRLRDAALSTPASDWLEKHDAEVRAKALEEMAHRLIGDHARQYASAIRALITRPEGES